MRRGLGLQVIPVAGHRLIPPFEAPVTGLSLTPAQSTRRYGQ